MVMDVSNTSRKCEEFVVDLFFAVSTYPQRPVGVGPSDFVHNATTQNRKANAQGTK